MTREADYTDFFVFLPGQVVCRRRRFCTSYHVMLLHSSSFSIPRQRHVYSMARRWVSGGTTLAPPASDTTCLAYIDAI